MTIEYAELKYDPDEDCEEDIEEFDLVEEVVYGDRRYTKAFNGTPFRRE